MRDKRARAFPRFTSVGEKRNDENHAEREQKRARRAEKLIVSKQTKKLSHFVPFYNIFVWRSKVVVGWGMRFPQPPAIKKEIENDTSMINTWMAIDSVKRKSFITVKAALFIPRSLQSNAILISCTSQNCFLFEIRTYCWQRFFLYSISRWSKFI